MNDLILAHNTHTRARANARRRVRARAYNPSPLAFARATCEGRTASSGRPRQAPAVVFRMT
eukprot:3476692-Pleurochrysis_carterae.AAC.1